MMNEFSSVSKLMRKSQEKFNNCFLPKKALHIISEVKKTSKIENQILNVPPFEGSLQQRSYPKLVKIDKAHYHYLNKIGRIITAYKGSLYESKDPRKSLTPQRLEKRQQLKVSKSAHSLKHPKFIIDFAPKPVSQLPTPHRAFSSKNSRKSCKNHKLACRSPNEIQLSAWKTADN